MKNVPIKRVYLYISSLLSVEKFSQVDTFIQFLMVAKTGTKLIPNWALGALLGGLVAGTYIFSIKAVGDDSAEVGP